MVPVTPRERWLATMRFEARDRVPLCDFGFWPETLDEWKSQGLPEGIQSDHEASAYFEMDVWDRSTGIGPGLCPRFPYMVLEDRGDHEVVQQGDGVRVLRKKWMGSIPQHLGHLLTDRDAWREHYLPKLDPDHPDRWPAGWDARIAEWRDPKRAETLMLWGGSLYGWLRDWMGVEAISYAVYDDPAWFEEMVETLTVCAEAVLRRQLQSGVAFDGCGFWEDMCFASGPLLAPNHFEKYLVPRYRRLADLLRGHGVRHIWVDCDGKIDALIPLWLGAGVDTMFPVEVGSWGGDVTAYRREFGRDLRMMGGFDKRILARGPAAIDAEIERLTPLVDEGGYIPFCDHRVPPDVSLANYRHYLARARERWG